MLLDHGCDCYAIVLQSFILLKTLQIGNNYFLMLGLFTTTQSFYFSILEEYYVGGLYIGIMNAVTDCSIIVVIIYIFAAIYSN